MSTKILVLNSGSSSLKFKIFEEAANSLKAIVGGVVERIGGQSALQAEIDGRKQTHKEHVKDHTAALDTVLQFLQQSQTGNVTSVKAIGHRVVHGKDIREALLVDDRVIQAIKDATDLAPLHNPANLEGILAVQRIFKGKPSVAVFDTAFHQSMPPKAYLYALPYDLYKERGLRRYGAHGTSVQYLVKRAALALGKPVNSVNLIVAHLGAGASLTAIEKGQSLDTSMGMTPLEGLMMMTRCGDLDCSAVTYLQNHCGLTAEKVGELLNSKSGFKGLTGSSDLREVLQQREKGNLQADSAIQVFIHRLRKYLGAYLLHLKGDVDAIVFSAGMGENSPFVREHALADLEAFGISVDAEKNKQTVGGRAGSIESETSGVKILVIPTDEELSIAEQTIDLVNRL